MEADGLVRVVVPGNPVPWARARRKGKRYFTAPEVAAHATVVRQAWMAAGRPHLPQGVACTLSARFHLARPEDHWGTGRNAGQLRPSAPPDPIGRPDIDNYVKLVADALNGHWWHDDSQIVCLAGVHKLYVAPGEQPRTVIDAWPCSTRLTLHLTRPHS